MLSIDHEVALTHYLSASQPSTPANILYCQLANWREEKISRLFTDDVEQRRGFINIEPNAFYNSISSKIIIFIVRYLDR